MIDLIPSEQCASYIFSSALPCYETFQMKLLYDKAPDPALSNFDHRTIIGSAFSQISKITRLLRLQATSDEMLLLEATRDGAIDTIRLLLDKGTNASCRDPRVSRE